VTAQEILKELKPLGTENYKNTMLKHGVKEPVFGVKIEELKKIQKRVKKDYKLALELFDTGVYDAMYLAGLIADDDKMSRKDLQHWAESANCHAISEYTVAWVAAEGNHGFELARKWIDSKKESVASAGWTTLSGLVALKDDAELDLAELKQLMSRVQKTIHQQPNRVRHTMNGFIISVGTYVKPLTKLAIETGDKIGPVTVDMGDTACKVPSINEYIKKAEKRGSIGKKRKTVKC
jgi:3-methyladenine DNA glycosylase AlkD